MKRFLKSCLGLVALTLVLAQPVLAKPKHLFVVLDISGSQDILSNKAVNARVAARTAEIIAGLELAFDDKVSLRTLGEVNYAATINLRIDEHLTFAGGLHPAVIPSEIQTIIHSLHGMAGQSSTHIAYAVEALGYEMSCQDRDTVVILVSDGAATGEVDPATGRMADLPAGMFANCGSSPLYVVGFGASSYFTNAPGRLRQTMRELNRFAKHGGFPIVQFIN